MARLTRVAAACVLMSLVAAGLAEAGERQRAVSNAVGISGLVLLGASVVTFRFEQAHTTISGGETTYTVTDSNTPWKPRIGFVNPFRGSIRRNMFYSGVGLVAAGLILELTNKPELPLRASVQPGGFGVHYAVGF